MPKLPTAFKAYLILGAIMLAFASGARWDNADGLSYIALAMAFFLLEPWVFFGSSFANWGLSDFQLFVLFYCINAAILFVLFVLPREKNN